MDDLTLQLEQILNDPERIQQLKSLASMFPPQDTSETDRQPMPEMLDQMNRLFHQTKAREEKQQALVHALLPYLRPERQAKLERAMRIAQLSSLAGAALRSSPAPQTREEDTLV